MTKNRVEQYHPPVEEQLSVQEHLTPVLRELSDIRQLFLENEPRIAELPEDFSATPDIQTCSGGAGSFDYLQRRIAGTFDDRGRIEIIQRTPPRSTDENDLRWSGVISSPTEKDVFGRAQVIGELTPEEAQEMFDELYPVAKAFSQMKASERQIREKYWDLRSEQELQAREAEQEKTLHIEKTKQKAFAEGKTIGRYEGKLEARLDGIEISEEDEEFVYDTIGKIAIVASGSDSLTLMRDPVDSPQTDEERQRKRKHEEDYARRMDIVRQLLGVVDDPVKWTNVGNFAQRYAESHTYSTVLPGLVFIEGDNRRDFGVVSDESTVVSHKKVVEERLVVAGKN